LISKLLQAQTLVKGTVLDEITNEPIPYASVGLLGKSQGMICDGNGNFELSLHGFLDTDTLKFTSIGYEPKLILMSQAKTFTNEKVKLKALTTQLSEVKVKAGKGKILGTQKFSKKTCTAFIGVGNNWRGEEAAIRANNNPGTLVYLEEFRFYVIKNLYEDSLVFRLCLYEVNEKEMPGKMFLQKPIIFKTKVKQGDVFVDLREYFIFTDKDFFISLECLMNKMEATQFCFSGSIDTPSYTRTSFFTRWRRVSRGGADLSIKASYQK
jgi:hypothetical protein